MQRFPKLFDNKNPSPSPNDMLGPVGNNLGNTTFKILWINARKAEKRNIRQDIHEIKNRKNRGNK